MSARPATYIEQGDNFDEVHEPLGKANTDENVLLVDEPKPGLFASIRNGIQSLANLMSRYRSTMDEVNSWHREVLTSGRQGMAPQAETRLPLSASAEIFSESDELVAEATMREDVGGSALLRLKTPTTLPQKIIVRTSAGESGRMATVKWSGDSSAIIEFD
jgi:hypothetical protein